MDVNFVYNEAASAEPIYIEQVFAEKPGGGMVVNPAVDFPPSTPVYINSNGKFQCVKSYRLAADVAAADTSIKIEKGSGIVSGDVLGHGSLAVASTAVDTTNPAYDVVTITLGVAIDKGVVLYEAAAASANAAAPKYTPVYVLGTPVFAGKGDQPARLINGANLRKETANLSSEVAALLPNITLV